MDGIKLSNAWEHFPQLFSDLTESDERALKEYFNLETGELTQFPGTSLWVLVEKFVNSESFREMFTGYTTEEVSAIVVKYQESKQNALAIQNQILKLYQGWVVFNTGILREDAVKYRLLKSAFDHADKVYQELNEKWTYTQITKDRAKQYKMSSARNARNAAERAIEKFLFGTADLMKMLKSIGLEVSKDQTTMIKGFHQQSGDFKVSRGDIDLYGFTGTSKFNEIIKMLNEAGYVIDHKSDPYRSPSTGMRASITVKMKHNPSLLADAHI